MKDNQFDNRRRIIGAIAGPLLAAFVWWMPIGALSVEAHRLLAIVSLVAVWWITEPVPSPVTSLLGPTLCVLLGVAPVDKAFANFANPMMFLFMGGFLLAKGMMVNGLDKRIAYGITSMKWVGDSPRRIFLAIGLACMLCSGWISNTATAAMMFPVSLGLLEAIRAMMAANGKTIDLHDCKYATGLMLMTAYACSIGGVMTPIGTPPNIIMIGFLGELAPDAPAISFFQWMAWGVVAMAAYFAVAYVVLWRMFPADVDHIEGAQAFIRRKADELGPWTRAQKNTLFAFATAVVLWVAPSVLSLVHGPHSDIMKAYDSHCPEAIAAMFGGLLLFFLPVDLKMRDESVMIRIGIRHDVRGRPRRRRRRRDRRRNRRERRALDVILIGDRRSGNVLVSFRIIPDLRVVLRLEPFLFDQELIVPLLLLASLLDTADRRPYDQRDQHQNQQRKDRDDHIKARLHFSPSFFPMLLRHNSS